MVVRDILRALARRWYVLLVALLGAGALGMVFYQDGGGFVTKTAVVFSLPQTSSLMPENGVGDESVIAFAGVVATEVNGGKQPMRYAAADAPYYGAGLREGISIGLPNAGGQWVASYNSAIIEIQIVGRTREWVETKQRETLQQVLAAVSAQQAGASPDEAIKAAVEPLTMRIIEVAASRMSVILAFGALLMAALLCGGWACVRLDRALLARARMSSQRIKTTRGVT